MKEKSYITYDRELQSGPSYIAKLCLQQSDRPDDYYVQYVSNIARFLWTNDREHTLETLQ